MFEFVVFLRKKEISFPLATRWKIHLSKRKRKMNAGLWKQKLRVLKRTDYCAIFSHNIIALRISTISLKSKISRPNVHWSISKMSRNDRNNSPRVRRTSRTAKIQDFNGEKCKITKTIFDHCFLEPVPSVNIMIS